MYVGVLMFCASVLLNVKIIFFHTNVSVSPKSWQQNKVDQSPADVLYTSPSSYDALREKTSVKQGFSLELQVLDIAQDNAGRKDRENNTLNNNGRYLKSKDMLGGTNIQGNRKGLRGYVQSLKDRVRKVKGKYLKMESKLYAKQVSQSMLNGVLNNAVTTVGLKGEGWATQLESKAGAATGDLHETDEFDRLVKEIGTIDDVPQVRVPNINCADVFADDTKEKANARILQEARPKIPVEESIYISDTSDCEHFIAKRHYTMRPLHEEEAQFSIAYSILVFRDVEQFERLLRSIYRPQNFYCVHVDRKSSSSFYKAVTGISSCFVNVFTTSRRVDVTWGRFTVIEPELICMEELLKRSKRWRYFINLTGQEFPLKTNWDIVKILTVFNGSNNMEGTVARLLTDTYLSMFIY
jgi:Core-2/I-Branching enzyme